MALSKGVSLSGELFPGNPMGRVAVAPDAQSIAWAPELELKTLGDPRLPFVSIADVSKSVRPLMLPGNYAVDFAVSNAGRLLVLAGVVGAGKRRLLVLTDGAENIVTELTDSEVGIPLSLIVSLSICGSGQFAVVASDQEFALIDLARRGVVMKSNGHSPSLSPDGDRIAFLDGQLGLVVRSLKPGTSTRLLSGIRVTGTGAWSPNGRYLLLGAFTSFSFHKRLLALDYSSQGVCELALLREGDDGGRSVWVSKHLALA
jgi:hypothetical protein